MSRPRNDPVADWRARRLELAGVPRVVAERLAATGDIDLHALLQLIERGCPPHLAVRILAPIDK